MASGSDVSFKTLFIQNLILEYSDATETGKRDTVFPPAIRVRVRVRVRESGTNSEASFNTKPTRRH